MNLPVSVLVSTYERPEVLGLVLRGLARQSRFPDEVIVTDDGSGPATRKMLLQLALDFPVPLRHVWQEDRGFRLSASRNRGIAAARGDYLILLDGDMLVDRRFIADHLASARTGCFTQGMRAWAGPALTSRIIESGCLAVSPLARGLKRRRRALRIPAARLVHRARDYGRKRVAGCSQGFWRRDLLALNGFNEAMTGWGREDTELVIRAYHAGLRRIQLYGTAIAVHLHHPLRGDSHGVTANDPILDRTIRTGAMRCDRGVADYLAEYSAPPADLRSIAADRNTPGRSQDRAHDAVHGAVRPRFAHTRQ